MSHGTGGTRAQPQTTTARTTMTGTSLTHTQALIAQAIAAGHRYGFDIISATGLPSGTVYPALRRLEESGFIRGRWEDERHAHDENRPARRYYEIRPLGEKALAAALERFRHLRDLRLPATAGMATGRSKA